MLLFFHILDLKNDLTNSALFDFYLIFMQMSVTVFDESTFKTAFFGNMLCKDSFRVCILGHFQFIATLMREIINWKKN